MRVAQNVFLYLTCLLVGMSAGFFGTYYYSVTRALATVQDEVYVPAFQAINATIRGAEFGVIFFGSLVMLICATVVHLKITNVRNLLIGALIAYAILLGITFLVHIPLNDELALVDATQPELLAAGRERFEARWNEMHVIRSLFALLSFVLTLFAVFVSPHRKPRNWLRR